MFHVIDSISGELLATSNDIVLAARTAEWFAIAVGHSVVVKMAGRAAAAAV